LRRSAQLLGALPKSVNSQRKAWADRAEASGYLPHIRAIAQNATAPIWWSRASSPIGNAVIHNGTATFVNTGKKTICVTAGHVFEKYRAHKQEFVDFECQVGSVRVELENYLVDYSSELDLATFELSPILLAASRASAHGAPKWPPARLAESEIVVLGGYPGLLRIEENGRLGTPFVSFLAPVAQASPDHSAVQLNLEDAYWPDGSGGLAPASELGGMSGGPLFRYRPEPVEHFELVGFIYQASPSYGIVFARHGSCIDDLGRIADDTYTSLEQPHEG
jgi:hypothetical protein